MINPAHLRDRVVRPTLEHLGLWSLAAEQLVMGTAAQESNLRHLVQVGGGPALGLWQMEPATYEDIWANYLRFQPDLRAKLSQLVAGWPLGARQLASNHVYAAALCRVHYKRVRVRLPEAGDVRGMAEYWKRWYNTSQGKGTPEEFVHNWRLVEGLYRAEAA